MNALQRIEAPAKPSLSLELPESMAFEEWVDVMRRLCAGQQVLNWHKGDAWAFGDHRYGDRAKLAAEGIFGLEFQSLVDMATVCRAFESTRRRVDLSFTHHREVTALPAAQADALLERAAREKLSTRDLRREVQALKAANDPGEEGDLQPGEPRPPTLTEDERLSVEFAGQLIHRLERWQMGKAFDEEVSPRYYSEGRAETDAEWLLKARAYYAKIAEGRWTPPDDFEVIFVEKGREEAEPYYHTARRMIDRWLILCGMQRLIDKRAEFVAYGRRQNRPPQPEPAPPPIEVSATERRIAALAAAYLQKSENGGWVVYPHPSLSGMWVRGQARETAEELIAFAERKGFDREAANLQIAAEQGEG